MNFSHFQILLKQTKALTLANLKTRYRNTWSGYLWVLLNPILLFGAQSYAFHYILKINIEKYPLYLAMGLLPWIFITTSTEMSVGILINNGRLLKSLKINPLVFVFAQVIDNFINYISAFLVLLIPIGFWLSWDLSLIFYLFLPLISLLIFVCSFSFLFSQIQVFFRDTRFILSFVFQFCFYTTPIFYPRELVPEPIKPFLKFNFFVYLIRPFQILSQEFSVSHYLVENTASFSISLTFLLITFVFWRVKKNEIYFYL